MRYFILKISILRVYIMIFMSYVRIMKKYLVVFITLFFIAPVLWADCSSYKTTDVEIILQYWSYDGFVQAIEQETIDNGWETTNDPFFRSYMVNRWNEAYKKLKLYEKCLNTATTTVNTAKTPIQMCQDSYWPNVYYKNTTNLCYCNVWYDWNLSKTTCELIKNVITYTNVTGDTSNYINELQESVERLNQNWLTKFTNIQDFMANQSLRRDEAAKFFVQYAKGILNLVPDQTKIECNLLKDVDKWRPDLKDFIKDACKLWLFQWSKWYFMPQNALTNAEAMTVAIRMIDGKKDETQQHFAQKYFEKAKEFWILSWLKLNYIANFDNLTTRGEIGKLLFRVSKINFNKGSLEKNIIQSVTKTWVNTWLNEKDIINLQENIKQNLNCADRYEYLNNSCQLIVSDKYPYIISISDDKGNVPDINGLRTKTIVPVLKIWDTVNIQVSAIDPNWDVLEYNWNSSSQLFNDWYGRGQYFENRNIITYTITADDLKTAGNALRIQVQVRGKQWFHKMHWIYDDHIWLDYELQPN